LRAPRVHSPREVVRLLQAIVDADRAVQAGAANRERNWFGLEIDLLKAVLRHAADHGEAIVSALDLPNDTERAAKIRIPFTVTSTK